MSSLTRLAASGRDSLFAMLRARRATVRACARCSCIVALATVVALAPSRTTAANASTVSAGSPLTILFVGNSFVRGVRRPLQQMLQAAGVEALLQTAAVNSWTLARHARNTRTYRKIGSRAWHYVFLQEQSDGITRSAGYEPARALDAAVRAAGARAGFFMTWRDRGDSPESYDPLLGVPGGDFGYVPIALELGAPIAPVGWAIRNFVVEGVTVDLWKGGPGHHLNPAGNYLAACVLYAVLTGTAPNGVYRPRYLDPGVAATLERIASDTVLSDPSQWGLPPP